MRKIHLVQEEGTRAGNEPGLKAPRQAQDFKQRAVRTSLEIQWLGLCASNAGGGGSVPDQGTKIGRLQRAAKKSGGGKLKRARKVHRPGVPSLLDLMPEDLRWSRRSNSRNKVHNKYSVLESS